MHTRTKTRQHDMAGGARILDSTTNKLIVGDSLLASLHDKYETGRFRTRRVSPRDVAARGAAPASQQKRKKNFEIKKNKQNCMLLIDGGTSFFAGVVELNFKKTTHWPGVVCVCVCVVNVPGQKHRIGPSVRCWLPRPDTWRGL